MNCIVYKDYRIWINKKYSESSNRNFYSSEIYTVNNDNVIWKDEALWTTYEKARERATDYVNSMLDLTYVCRSIIVVGSIEDFFTREFAVYKEELQNAIDTQVIDRSLLFTPEDIIWLREWLPKLANSEIEYDILDRPHRTR